MKKRNRMIAGMMAAVMAASLSGCGVKVSTSAEQLASAEQTAAAQAAETAAAATGDGKITLKVIDWSDSTKARRDVYNQKFMEENPNVTVEYTVLTADQFKETVISAIKAGNAPDLFPVPSGMKLSAALKEGWFMPMNEYLPQEFTDSFATGALNEGITTMDGQIYALPESANIINTLIFYNKNVLREAGVDVNSLPKTWSEFAAVCRQVTEAGKGKFYGVIDSGAQVNRLELAVRSLASLDGGKCGDISQILMTDGKNPYGTEAMANALAFYDGLVKDGSFHPNSVTMKAPEARALFAQNQAAFIMQGAWCIATWRQDNPELDFGVMEVPVPDGGIKGKLPYTGAQPWMGISSGCKYPEMAAKYLMGLYSEDYQSGLVEDGGFVSVIDAVNEKYMTDEIMLEYYKLNSSQAALVPDPIVGNPDTAEVYAEASAISPSLGEIVQGILAQNIDYQAEIATLGQKTQAEWERAIGAAKQKGADVSAEDFDFANWDSMKDYTAEMYTE